MPNGELEKFLKERFSFNDREARLVAENTLDVHNGILSGAKPAKITGQIEKFVHDWAYDFTALEQRSVNKTKSRSAKEKKKKQLDIFVSKDGE